MVGSLSTSDSPSPGSDKLRITCGILSVIIAISKLEARRLTTIAFDRSTARQRAKGTRSREEGLIPASCIVLSSVSTATREKAARKICISSWRTEIIW